jgi:hypothetical protein
MSMTKLVAAAAAALMISVGAASAQSTAPAQAAPAPGAAATTAKKPAIKPAAERTPESLKCSAEADKQNLHGKPRQAFRKKCMADAKKAAAQAAAPATAPAKKN